MTAAPLRGWTVGVTADRRADEQIELLARRGARVVHGPTIRTLPLGGEAPLRAALDALAAVPPDWVVFTTGIGTRALFEAADAAGRADAIGAGFRAARRVARGPKAAGAAITVGLGTEWQAPTGRSVEVVDYLRGCDVRGRRVAVQLDGRDEPALGDAIRALGADVVDLPVYRWTLPEESRGSARLIAEAVAGRLDAVTFTSAPALRNCADLAQHMGLRDELLVALRGPVAMVSIGVVCTEAAHEMGIEPAV